MKLRRALLLATAGGLLLASGPVSGPASAAPNFNPVMTATRNSDAARAATGLHVRIAQPDGQEQIGKLRIAVPRTYTFDTNAPGDGAQIGTAQLQAYINPRPAGQLSVDATVHDGNDDCDPGSQCVIVRANIPGIGAIELPLEIEQTATEYVIGGDISSLWNDSYVRGIDARLKELRVDINARVGNHVVFGNASTAGNHPFTYAFESAKIAALGHAGGQVPDCGAVCAIDLESVDYAPTRPGLRTPASATVSADDTAQTFAWSNVSDANGDAVTFTLDVAGPTPIHAENLTTTSFAAGALAPGSYTWTVTAVDSTGQSTASVAWTLNVIDAAASMRFVSVTNNDVLLVSPGTGFVYRLGGAKTTAAEYGAAADVSDTRGLISYSGGRFSLVGAYDSATGTAVLSLVQGTSSARPFVDPIL